MAIVADHTMVKFHGRERVKHYILALMNIVSIYERRKCFYFGPIGSEFIQSLCNIVGQCHIQRPIAELEHDTGDQQTVSVRGQGFYNKVWKHKKVFGRCQQMELSTSKQIA